MRIPSIPRRCHLRATLRLLPALTVLAALGAGSAAAQTDCAGFLEHPIGATGTNGAAAIHAADLNGDDRVDLITASANDDTIAWYRNPCGDPGVDCLISVPAFERRVIATDADGVTSVHAVDVDEDGDVDVLAASANDSTVALYENISSGSVLTFVRFVISNSARRAQSVYAARVDGDEDIDILSASFTDNTIAWYENPRITNAELSDEASFGFTRRVVSTSAVNPSDVFAIDLDGDGDTDVLSASIADDKIAWYENTGVANDEDDEPQQMFTEHVITRQADGARSVFAADLDGDDDIDVLSASISDDTVAWYENDGATPPAFTMHEISTVADGAKSIHATDLNGDGDVDIVVAAEQAGAVYWYENDGQADPTFTERLVSADVVSADAVFAADVNGDGFVDVLSASSVPGSVSNNDKVAWHENDQKETPNFTERVVATTAEGLAALTLADLDGDGEDDVVAATTTNQIVWFAIDAGPPVAFNRNLIADGVLDPRSVFVNDLDQDGDLDVLSASAGNDRILWHVNGQSTAKGGGAPVFVATRVIASGLDTVESIFVADLDGDGYGDVASASSGDDKVAWFHNPCGEADCSGETLPDFPARILSSIDSEEAPIRTANARSVFIVDVDGDDDNDILAASSGDDKVTLFVNQGHNIPASSPPEFLERIIASANLNDSVFVEPGAFSVAATDIDNDDDVDLLVAASGLGSINWYEQDVDPDNEGLTTFTQRPINQLAPLAVFVGFHDVDGDGDQDVLATTFGDDRVLWHENRLEEREDPGDTLVFRRHFVNFDGSNPRAVVLTDVDNDGTVDLDMDGQPDDDLDMIAGFRFRTSWFERIGELCTTFDVDGDEFVDGIELAWLGRAFGLSSATPAAEWWGAVDFNRDGVIDGLDLAILSSPGVWGESTAIVDGVAECSYTCQ